MSDGWSRDKEYIKREGERKLQRDRDKMEREVKLMRKRVWSRKDRGRGRMKN